MSLYQKPLYGSAATVGSTFPNQKQVSQWDGVTVTFGTDASESLLDFCTPVGFNDTTSKYAEWMAPDPTVMVVDLTDATAGNFTLTVNGATTGNIAYNASAVAVVAALKSIGYAVTCTLASAVYTITFGADDELSTLPTVTGTVSGITGGSPTATATAGTATYGTHIIKGFVWPEKIQLDDTYDVQGVIMIYGRIPYAAISDTVDSGDLTALQTELKRTPLGRGIIVEDLVNVH